MTTAYPACSKALRRRLENLRAVRVEARFELSRAHLSPTAVAHFSLVLPSPTRHRMTPWTPVVAACCECRTVPAPTTSLESSGSRGRPAVNATSPPRCSGTEAIHHRQARHFGAWKFGRVIISELIRFLANTLRPVTRPATISITGGAIPVRQPRYLGLLDPATQPDLVRPQHVLRLSRQKGRLDLRDQAMGRELLQRRESNHPLVDEAGHLLASHPVGPLRRAVVGCRGRRRRRRSGMAPRDES